MDTADGVIAGLADQPTLDLAPQRRDGSRSLRLFFCLSDWLVNSFSTPCDGNITRYFLTDPFSKRTEHRPGEVTLLQQPHTDRIILLYRLYDRRLDVRRNNHDALVVLCV